MHGQPFTKVILKIVIVGLLNAQLSFGNFTQYNYTHVPILSIKFTMLISKHLSKSLADRHTKGHTYACVFAMSLSQKKMAKFVSYHAQDAQDLSAFTISFTNQESWILGMKGTNKTTNLLNTIIVSAICTLWKARCELKYTLLTARVPTTSTALSSIVKAEFKTI